MGALIGGEIAALIVIGIIFARFLSMSSSAASDVAPTVGIALTNSMLTASAPSITPLIQPINIITIEPDFTSTVTQIGKPVQSLTSTFTPIATPTLFTEDALAEQITQLLPKYGGDWNILIREDGNRAIYAHNPNKKDHMASIVKVPLAMLFFKSLEEQGIPPFSYSEYLSEYYGNIGRTYKQLLRAMLVDSEEEAALAIRNYIGDTKIDIQGTVRSWGALHTDISKRESSPEDIATLLESLYYQSAITPEGSQFILDMMSEYTTNDDTRMGVIRPLLPEGSHFYNKRGTVTDPRLVIADSALITLNQNGNEKIYTIVALSYWTEESPTTNVRLEHGIEAIARLFWSYVAQNNP